MLRRVVLAASCLLILPALLLAQEGKLRGRVTDKETGEPLIGANVTLEGTTLGAAADLNGDYVVLGVPPSVYTVRVSYIGYQPLALANVRVSAGLTTTEDFQLSASPIEVAAVEVVAERPLIQRNTTNTVRMTTQEDIQNIPIRGLQNIIALNAGTVMQDGILHVRGGRVGEIFYLIDGATAYNPMFNSENVAVIQEAIEELQLQSGGYTAEFGGANSAIVRTTVRTGGPQYKVSADYRTDDFAKPGKQFLKTSPFGFRNAVVTVSGPVPGLSKLTFFVAGQHNYLRDRQIMFLEPFEFRSLRQDNTGARPEGELLPDSGNVIFKRNHLPGNWSLNNKVQGTLTYDWNPVKFRLTGSYEVVRLPSGRTWPGVVRNYFNERNTNYEQNTLLLNLKATHLLNPTTFYEAAVSYSDRSARSYDPDFGDDWKSYADSLTSAKLGYTGWLDRFDPPLEYRTINAFVFDHPSYPITGYSKNSQSSMGASVDFTSQVTPRWELKAGARLDRWTMRSFSVGNILAYNVYLYGKDGKATRTFTSDYERRVELSKRAGIGYIGYDYEGNKLDSGPNGPRHPVFASFYAQNKLEYRDLILNFGLRYERFDVKALKPADLERPAFDKTLDYVKEDELVETEGYDYFLPRVTFSFPVTDRTVFYALYGKYVQMPSLSQVYMTNVALSRMVSPITREPYGWWTGMAGFTAKPERTTQYEMGIRQALSDNFAFTITGFYKDLLDQLRWDKVLATGEEDLARGQPVFAGLLNNDFGTVKGIELTMELRRVKRLAGKVNYTLSSTRGTGSDSRSSRVVVSDETTARYPTLIYSLDYHQPHRGTVMLDYRFPKGDGGKILEGMGLNMLLYFNSGHSYTQIMEPLNLGQASPWNIGVRALIDPRNRHPVEPLNTSMTPWNFSVDMTLNKVLYFSKFNAEIYVNVLNLFNTKQVINVYPTTGTAEDDGWLRSPFASPFLEIENYEAFYRAINVDNRWGYFVATGNDLYGTPRQIRLGLRLEL